jgi:hypothetical protein
MAAIRSSIFLLFGWAVCERLDSVARRLTANLLS